MIIKIVLQPLLNTGVIFPVFKPFGKTPDVRDLLNIPYKGRLKPKRLKPSQPAYHMVLY